MAPGSPTIGAVVPALDEAPAIGAVVRGLRATGLLDEIVVVDNGSTDGTARIAEAAGARAVVEPRRGYGRACLAGVRALSSDIVLLLDGDAADDLRDVDRVLEPLLRGEADLVVGARTRGVERGAMTPQQVAGNHIAVTIIGALYRCAATDLGPLRAIRREHLLRLRMREMTYGWSTEMVVKAARAGYRYREVAVGYHRRVGISKVGGNRWGSVRAGGRILSATVRYAAWRPAADRRLSLA
ncbi:MAG: glycosyltransferase family 2 protein [Candidatus Dormibacteraceae bacterium]